MRQFNDKNGQAWSLELTIGQARKSFDIGNPESLTALLDEPYSRFDMLWLMCEKQAKERNIDVDQFDLLLAEENAMIAAHDALLLAINDFFQRIGKPSLSLLMTKSRAAAKRLETLATEKVNTIDSQLEKVIQSSMKKIDQAIEKSTQQTAGS